MATQAKQNEKQGKQGKENEATASKEITPSNPRGAQESKETTKAKENAPSLRIGAVSFNLESLNKTISDLNAANGRVFKNEIEPFLARMDEAEKQSLGIIAFAKDARRGITGGMPYLSDKALAYLVDKSALGTDKKLAREKVARIRKVNRILDSLLIL